MSKLHNIYIKSILSRKVKLPFNILGNNIESNILEKLNENISGKCICEGYIKKNSIEILSYSAGHIMSKYVIFDVSFNCLLCSPVEGMEICCIIKNKTRAGFRAAYYNSKKKKEELDNPVTIFVARDHHIKPRKNNTSDKNDIFKNTNIGDIIYIRVIGIRYQLNDDSISLLGEYLKNTCEKQKLTIQKNKKK
tara:strand:- start:877 stop:1455 length:579 start_codon:yes stop_codon:yes gene_type:complete